MAKRALYQLTERIIAVATDLFHIGNSNKDYRITGANLFQYIWAYLTGTYFITLTAKNISAGPQTTTLDIYQAGGASEKPNGFRIKVPWTGGNKSFSHSFVATGYTIGGVSVGNWVGWFTGFLTLELDKTNSNWIIVNIDPIWDYGQTATASGVYQIVERYTNRKMKIIICDTNSRAITTNISAGVYSSGNVPAVNFSISFSSAPRCIGGTSVGTTTSNVSWVNFNGIQTASASRQLTLLAHASITTTYEITHKYEGIEVVA